MAWLVGVAGGSGAGKSAIVRGLASQLGAAVVELDAYYLDRKGLVPAERSRLNFDEPAALDKALLVEHLRRLAAGEAIEKPIYSFLTHTRSGVERVEVGDVVVLEGLFALWWPEVRERLNLKVFVDAPPDVRLARRLERDFTERGRSVESVLAQYFATVRPMHERYVEPGRIHADLVVDNTGALDDGVAKVVAALRGLVRGTPAGAGR